MDILTFVYDFFVATVGCVAAMFIYDYYKNYRNTQPNEKLESTVPIELSEKHTEDDDLIAQVRAASTHDNIVNELSGISASSGEQSFEEMSSRLISMTRTITESLDKSNTISSDKKNEIMNLLKAAPDFIGKIADMDPNELEQILDQTRTREPDFLVKTLDALRS